MCDAAADEPAPPAPAVPLREAGRAWVRVAAYSFGGPAGQIAVLHRVVVDEKRWVDEQTFLRLLGYCMVLPGPEAQQLATFLGWKLNGVRGGLLAGGLFILPGFASILALSIIYVTFEHSPVVAAVFYGLKPAVLAIVLQALLRLQQRALTGTLQTTLAAVAFLALFLFDLPFPLVIVAAAAVGIVARSAVAPTPLHEISHTQETHTRGRARASVSAGLAFLVLWLVSVAVIVGLLTSSHVLAREAIFFSKTAVVTFGGAYAVLTYVAQQAVEVYGWVTPGEMLDGLGLAETTPGPLIQVVQFVGFLGAYRSPGSMSPVAAGVVGSVVTTWVTFAPCFFFVFAGAPFLERMLRRRWLAGAVGAITAAVVGVVLNLAAWFSLHTLFAETRRVVAGPLALDAPVWSTIDAGAVIIAGIAAVLALRFKVGIFGVLAVGAALGLAMTLLR